MENTYVSGSEPYQAVPDGDRAPFQWLGTEAQLAYLFDQLIARHFLRASHRNRLYTLLARHFVNKTGRGFKNKQIREAYVRALERDTRTPKGSERLDSILGDMESFGGG
jgi:hypothetical protein